MYKSILEDSKSFQGMYVYPLEFWIPHSKKRILFKKMESTTNDGGGVKCNDAVGLYQGLPLETKKMSNE
jgi:hypothetical protein